MTLFNSLKTAISTCAIDHEEHGGIILVKDDVFEFIKLKNENTGTSTAYALWTADRNEFSKLIIPRLKDGWRQYASFHVHPSFTAYPSSIDLTKLFLGFPINYIYSTKDNVLMEYKYNKDDDVGCWEAAQIIQNDEEPTHSEIK